VADPLRRPASSTTATAQTATTPGALSAKPPTLVSLGFDWRFAGDDNRNARADVAFREK
jgi:hypothetical protein